MVPFFDFLSRAKQKSSYKNEITVYFCNKQKMKHLLTNFNAKQN